MFVMAGTSPGMTVKGMSTSVINDGM